MPELIASHHFEYVWYIISQNETLPAFRFLSHIIAVNKRN
jgi:hypothetical protein